MATNGFTSAGALIGVSATAPATPNKVGYEALTFTNIGEITDMGEIGKTYSEITHRPIDQRGEYVFKGNFSRGTMNLQMAAAFANDAGQVILDEAVDEDDDYYFKIEFNDNPSGASNTIFYFPAKVMSNPISIGNADSITTQATTLRVNGDIVVVAAVA